MSRTTIALFAMLFLWTGICAAETQVLRNLQLIDGTGADVRHVAALRIEDGRILAIDEAPDSGAPGSSDSVIERDLLGAWVMPGLIDTHVHIGRFPEAREEARKLLIMALAGGVTSIRDMGGDARALADLERAMHQGSVIGPTLVHSALYAGPAVFESPYIGGMAPGFEAGKSPWTQAVTEQTDLKMAIAASRGAGVHGLKLYGNLSADLLNPIVAEASRQNLLTWAHATVFPAGPGALVAAGVGSLSHAPYLVWEAVDEIPDDYSARIAAPWTDTPADHPRIRALFQSMAERGVYLDATLYVFDQMKNFSPQVQASWTGEALAWAVRATALAHKMGVPITAGTDWFEPREDESLPHTHDELALLVNRAGLSPMAALVAGTRNGAGALGILEERGTIEVGKAADLLVLEANPLDAIENTRKIRSVYKNGIEVPR